MRKMLFVIAFFLIAMPCLSASDLYLKSVTHTDAFEMMGQSQDATDSTQEIWIGADHLRMDSDNGSILMDLKEKQFYMINHDQKKYFQTSLPIDLKSIVPAEQAGFMDMMKFSVTVTPLEETKKIKEWNCKKYQMEMKSQMVNIKSDIWATEDIKIDQDKLEQFYVNTTALQNIDPGSMDELKKIKGFQVLSETTSEVMGTRVSQKTELMVAEEKETEKGHYTIPEGYEKSEQFMPMG